MPRDIERKRQRDLERYHRRKAAGRPPLTDAQKALARQREVKRTAWRLVMRHYLLAVKGGPALIARADRVDPGWRTAA